ncbi:MAG: polysaccharide deacetylase family protein [Prevotella sp.]|nr:polysaccharide deacetylase family protein [Prevotella sp.]
MTTLRAFARNRVLDFLGTLAKPANGIHILNGHRVQQEKEPETFRALLLKLRESVRFVRIEDAVQGICRHDTPDVPLVAFTFDDGFMECYDTFAPVLEEFNTNALFFVNPNYVDGDEAYIRNFNENIVMTPGKRPMRWQQLKELQQRGHLIGAHTMDHYMINSNRQDILEYQIAACRTAIEQQLGTPCEYFAFPYGKLTHANRQSIDIACNTYRYVFSQSDYKHYFSFNGQVINRRHFEPFWPYRHVSYFLSCNKTYPCEDSCK